MTRRTPDEIVAQLLAPRPGAGYLPDALVVHESHVFEATGWSAGYARWYEESHCSRCGLSVDDERIEDQCQEEPPQ